MLSSLVLFSLFDYGHTLVRWPSIKTGFALVKFNYKCMLSKFFHINLFNFGIQLLFSMEWRVHTERACGNMSALGDLTLQKKNKKKPLLQSTTKKMLKMVFFMTPSSFKISCQGMYVNSCRTNLYNNKIQLVETHFHLLFHPSYKATKSSIEDSRLEFLPWQTWVHFFSKRPRELTVINGSGRGTAAPTWGLALSSVFI